jgi:hypothetical protein
VPVTREVTVNQVSYQPQERSGTSRQLVSEWVPKNVTQTVSYCEMVPYQTTVRVPVYGPGPGYGPGYGLGHGGCY